MPDGQGRSVANDGSVRMLRSQAVSTSLRTRIVEREWAVGERLPSERALALEHGVGINTVRRAVATLEREGLVRRVQGSGTYLERVPAPGAAGSGPPLIGVVLPAAKYYAGGVIEGMGDALHGSEWRMLTSYSTFEPELELERCRELLALGVSGLLVSPSFYACEEPAAHLAALQALGVPVVLVERRPPSATGELTSYVATDRECAGHIAVRHLAALGRRRIGYFGKLGANSVDVHDAFLCALDTLGLPRLPKAIVQRRPWTRDDVADYVDRCRQLRVDAVFCMDDRAALLLLPALASAGLSVPDDVAVIAYDDIVSELATIPLTTVSPPKFAVGQLATELLLRLVTQGSRAAVCHAELQPRLTIRASCTAEVATSARGNP